VLRTSTKMIRSLGDTGVRKTVLCIFVLTSSFLLETEVCTAPHAESVRSEMIPMMAVIF